VTPLERLNAMTREEVEARMLACCGSRRWARLMAASRPFSSEDGLFESADRLSGELSEGDWLEAFAAHPRIGEAARGQAGREQSGTRDASEGVLAALAAANREYERKFGYIFIICASGKSAEEMLAVCRGRLHNPPAEELAVAAEEQKKITRLRLRRVLEDRP
jgi:OHCU decarboxylase